jgi:hypothetical protein
MANDAYYSFDDPGRGAASQRDSRFPFVHSQTMQPTRKVFARDQFRFSQNPAHGYDDVEDEGIEFDSFGMPPRLSRPVRFLTET